MRIFIAVLVVILNFQSWTKADNISELQLEGMSVGDSLLKHIGKDLIEKKYKSSYPASDEFYLIEFESSELNFLEEYSAVGIHLKKNDEKYKIYSMKGMNDYDNRLNACLEKKKEIIQSISNSFKNLKEETYERDFDQLYGNSKAYVSDFDISGGYIRVWCTDWDKTNKESKNWIDTVNVDLSSDEFMTWLNNDAY